MKKNTFNDGSFKFFIILIIIFYVLVVYLSVHNVINLNILAAPITIAFGLYFWKRQELMKSQALSAETMFKAFHNYAIQFVELYYWILPSLEKCSEISQEDLEELKTQYKELIKSRNLYFVERESFYRIADIPENVQKSIEQEFHVFDILNYNIREFLDSKSLNPKELKSFNGVNDIQPDNDFVVTIGKRIEDLIKPFIRYH
ncbi:hypothetical protein JZM37_13820 [Acinetobacter pittii]|uniref:hypothetical protein n=1 Tax=Acinetobacter pittii TaxID=48296 RepID=UPI0019807D82|nr:hypothetical protein [Acinetobacter pittii]MBN6525316.1 hypothetical protein [Acinetobacter pittii]